MEERATSHPSFLAGNTGLYASLVIQLVPTCAAIRGNACAARFLRALPGWHAWTVRVSARNPLAPVAATATSACPGPAMTNAAPRALRATPVEVMRRAHQAYAPAAMPLHASTAVVPPKRATCQTLTPAARLGRPASTAHQWWPIIAVPTANAHAERAPCVLPVRRVWRVPARATPSPARRVVARTECAKRGACQHAASTAPVAWYVMLMPPTTAHPKARVNAAEDPRVNQDSAVKMAPACVMARPAPTGVAAATSACPEIPHCAEPVVDCAGNVIRISLTAAWLTVRAVAEPDRRASWVSGVKVARVIARRIPVRTDVAPTACAPSPVQVPAEQVERLAPCVGPTRMDAVPRVTAAAAVARPVNPVCSAQRGVVQPQEHLHPPASCPPRIRHHPPRLPHHPL